MFFNLYMLYCNMRNFWNVFVISLFLVNTWCSFLNCIHSTLSKRKDCFDFLSIFRLLRSFQNTFFSRINSCCFFVFNKVSRIRWNDVFSMICSSFVSCSFLFKSWCFQKLKRTRESSQLKLFSFSLRDTWTLFLSRL